MSEVSSFSTLDHHQGHLNHSEPCRLATQSQMRIASSRTTMLQHVGILVADFELSCRRILYNHEKWQRQHKWQSGEGQHACSSWVLTKREADLDLQKSILVKLAQAENGRKGFTGDKNATQGHLRGTEQMLQELLMTTFTVVI